jgi:hypothetical protein
VCRQLLVGLAELTIHVEYEIAVDLDGRLATVLD